MRSAALALLLATLAAPASAQRSVDIQRFRPALDHQGFLGIQGTSVPGPWRWNVALWSTYVNDPLTAGGEDVIGHRLTSDLIAQVGIGGRFALALDVPLVLYQSSDQALSDGLGPIAAQAMGDPRIVARVRYWGDSFDVPRERTEGPGLAFLAAVTLPAGTEDAFAGEGAVTTELQALGDFHLFGAGAGLMVGWKHRFDQRELGTTVFRDELHFGLGAKVPIPVIEDFTVFTELRGSLDARDPFGGGPRSVVEADIGFGIRRHGLSIRTGVGTGFTDGVGTAKVRAFVGMSWAPQLADLDGDSIPDDVDQCIHLPEDFDGFEDSDGCQDPDNDMDFIPDVDDECPNEEALEGYDEDENGCTDPGAIPTGAPPPAQGDATGQPPEAAETVPAPADDDEGPTGPEDANPPSSEEPTSAAAEAAEAIPKGEEPEAPESDAADNDAADEDGTEGTGDPR